MNWGNLNVGTLLLIAIVLVCPISMIWMMRGRSNDTTPRGNHEREEGTGGPVVGPVAAAKEQAVAPRAEAPSRDISQRDGPPAL